MFLMSSLLRCSGIGSAGRNLIGTGGAEGSGGDKEVGGDEGSGRDEGSDGDEGSGGDDESEVATTGSE